MFTWLVATSILFMRHHGLDVNMSSSSLLLTSQGIFHMANKKHHHHSPPLTDCIKSSIMIWPSLDDRLSIEKSALAPLRCSRSSTEEEEQTNKQEEIIDMRQLVATLPFDNVDGGAWKQGWDVQPMQVDEQQPLQIFVVP